MSLVLYGRASSYNVQKVLWFLDELELPYQHIECGGKHGGLDTTEFGKFNPLRKVPVLLDCGVSVWESNTILRYIAATYAGEQWWNTSAAVRSEYERWMDWSIDKFESSFTGLFWGFYRTPELQRDIKSINRHKRDYLYCLAVMDQQLIGNEFLNGANISLSDITLGVFIYRLQGIGLDIDLPANVSRWYRTLKTRKSYVRWVMSDFSELKGRLTY